MIQRGSLKEPFFFLNRSRTAKGGKKMCFKVRAKVEFLPCVSLLVTLVWCLN